MRKVIRSPLLALGLIVVFAGTVLATSGSGFVPTPLARGNLSNTVQFNTGAVKLQTKESVDFVTFTVRIAAGGSSGWHSHPGVVLVTVASGSVVVYDADCSAEVHAANSAGSSFVESGDLAGLVRNESTDTAAVAYATYIVPAGTTALRIDRANPGCSQN